MAESEKPSVRKQIPPRRWLPPLLVGLGGILLLSAALLLFMQNRPAAGFPRVGQRMADFSLLDLNGREVHLSDYAGRTVLINAWATWCPPCQAEMPLLVQEYELRKASGFTILAINDGETREEAAAFAREYGLTFPVLLDTDAVLLDSMLIDNLPTTLVVGADGLVKAVHVGVLSPEVFAAEIAPHLP